MDHPRKWPFGRQKGKKTAHVLQKEQDKMGGILLILIRVRKPVRRGVERKMGADFGRKSAWMTTTCVSRKRRGHTIRDRLAQSGQIPLTTYSTSSTVKPSGSVTSGNIMLVKQTVR